MMNNLFREISKTVILNAADRALCESYFELVNVSRNSIVEEQDKTPQYLYFINTGFMRLFYYDDGGDEITTFLASPNGFIASFLSLIHEKPAPENVECITDCELLRIIRPNLIALIEQSENFKKFSLVIFEQVIALSQIRANDLATLTAELRYKKMIKEQPQLPQNIPVQYIASFLGIKPQSLSRIRRQIIL
ncbi:MAG: Crp/Fnr family transcriptional regulator [Ferruginibacter sp.]|nr:Crp/Fnr family transcriptional regulator [Ferruginibacter sp.]